MAAYIAAAWSKYWNIDHVERVLNAVKNSPVSLAMVGDEVPLAPRVDAPVRLSRHRQVKRVLSRGEGTVKLSRRAKRAKAPARLKRTKAPARVDPSTLVAYPACGAKALELAADRSQVRCQQCEETDSGGALKAFLAREGVKREVDVPHADVHCTLCDGDVVLQTMSRGARLWCKGCNATTSTEQGVSAARKAVTRERQRVKRSARGAADVLEKRLAAARKAVRRGVSASRCKACGLPYHNKRTCNGPEEEQRVWELVKAALESGEGDGAAEEGGTVAKELRDARAGGGANGARRAHRCVTCGGTGHNRRTCAARKLHAASDEGGADGGADRVAPQRRGIDDDDDDEGGARGTGHESVLAVRVGVNDTVVRRAPRPADDVELSPMSVDSTFRGSTRDRGASSIRAAARSSPRRRSSGASADDAHSAVSATRSRDADEAGEDEAPSSADGAGRASARGRRAVGSGTPAPFRAPQRRPVPATHRTKRRAVAAEDLHVAVVATNPAKRRVVQRVHISSGKRPRGARVARGVAGSAPRGRKRAHIESSSSNTPDSRDEDAADWGSQLGRRVRPLVLDDGDEDDGDGYDEDEDDGDGDDGDGDDGHEDWDDEDGDGDEDGDDDDAQDVFGWDPLAGRARM